MFNTNPKQQPLLSKATQKHYFSQKACTILSILCLLLTCVVYISREHPERILEFGVGANGKDKVVDSGAGVMSADTGPASPHSSPGASPPLSRPAEGSAAGPSTASSSKDAPVAPAHDVDLEAQQDSGNGKPSPLTPLEMENPPAPEKKHSFSSMFGRIELSKSSQTGVKCNDPEKGYEKQVGLCSKADSVIGHTRTTFESTDIPMVLDNEAHCRGDTCTKRDSETCCVFRRRCLPFYMRDVKTCPGDTTFNVYEGAYCRTKPCTQADADICCIPKTGQLFTRTDYLRSKYARVGPKTDSEPAVPHISFGYNQMIWTDISKKVTVGNDEWVPLVNFMDSWGENLGWKTDAWIRLSENGNAKYTEFPLLAVGATDNEQKYEHPHLRTQPSPVKRAEKSKASD